MTDPSIVPPMRRWKVWHAKRIRRSNSFKRSTPASAQNWRERRASKRTCPYWLVDTSRLCCGNDGLPCRARAPRAYYKIAITNADIVEGKDNGDGVNGVALVRHDLTLQRFQRFAGSCAATPGLTSPFGKGTAIGSTLTLATPSFESTPIFSAVEGERSTIRPLT